jgi:hypothetical protein
MGTWNSSILGNDISHDYLIDIINSIAAIIEQDIATMGTDGLLQRPTPVAVLVLHALAQNIDEVRRIIKLADVERWMNAFLAWFDANSREFGECAEAVGDERDEIEKLFLKLIGLIANRKGR